jgi:hypothetical protein
VASMRLAELSAGEVRHFVPLSILRATVCVGYDVDRSGSLAVVDKRNFTFPPPPAGRRYTLVSVGEGHACGLL